MLTEPKSRPVNPANLAAEKAVLQGQMSQQELQRLAEYLVDTAGSIEYRLRFRKRRDRRVHINGSASSKIMMACQYCLEPVELKIEAKIAQVVIANEAETSDLQLEQDFLVVDGETIELAAIFEDELILSLPMVARHGDGDETDNCLARLEYEKEEVEEQLPEKPNPFSVLKQLKEDKTTN